MVNYVKTTNGYFYKICKNSKKRISEDEYNKRRKIKKMTGGVQLERILVEQYNPKFEKIFMTGDISEGHSGHSSTVLQVQSVDPSIIQKLQQIKKNRSKSNSKNSLGIVYVGEIEYTTAARSHVSGKSHIWIRLNRSFGKVRYYVKIIENNNDSYGEHVKAALQTLCIEKCNLIIEALRKLDINLETNNSGKNIKKKLQLEQEILEIENQLKILNQTLTSKREILINKNYDLNSKCTDFNWTFPIQLNEQNN